MQPTCSILRQLPATIAAGLLVGAALTATAATFVWDGGGSNDNFTTAAS